MVKNPKVNKEKLFKLSKCKLDKDCNEISEDVSNPDQLMHLFCISYWKKIITKNDYKKLLTNIQGNPKNEEIIRIALSKRKDYRSFVEFGMTMLQNAEVEQKRIELWLEKYGKIHFPGYTSWKYTGVNSSGRIVFFGKTEMPDILLLPINVYVEYKDNNACNWKSSFKTDNLESYAKYDAAIVVVYMEFGQDTHYSVIMPETVKKIVDEFKNKKLKTFRFYGMGNKECVQFYHNLDKDQLRNKKITGKIDKVAVSSEKYFNLMEINC